MCLYSFFFFFNDTATTEIYTLSLHDALPILRQYGFSLPSTVLSRSITGRAFKSVAYFFSPILLMAAPVISPVALLSRMSAHQMAPVRKNAPYSEGML